MKIWAKSENLGKISKYLGKTSENLSKNGSKRLQKNK